MTVLIIPSWYKTESNPTLGSFFREQAMMLKERGINVIVADATFQGKSDYSSKRCFKMRCTEDEGLLTYSYVVPALGVGRMQSAGARIFLMNLRRIYKRIIKDGHKIDLIHAHSYLPAGWAAVMLGSEKNIPVVVTEHASDVLIKSLEKKRVNYLRETVAKAQAFICVSAALKKSVIELTEMTNDKIKVIPNAVDWKFKQIPKTKDNRFSFVSIGNLVYSKRFDLTIEAFASVAREHANCELKIIGDGILMGELKNLAKQCGVEDKVHFMGRISREQVVAELNESHVFVLPSDFETFGVVYVEAMACGLPVIGTRNGGAEDIVIDEVGLLIEKNNMSQLIVAMEKTLKSYSKYNSLEIVAYCQKRFGEDVVAKAIVDVYEMVEESNVRCENKI